MSIFGGVDANSKDGGNGTHFAMVETEVAESVPEPALILGLLTVGALGAGSALKRKKQEARSLKLQL